MTSVETRKLQELIDEHKRFQRVLESEQSIISRTANLLASIRSSYPESYVVSAVSAASASVERVKISSNTLRTHVDKKKTGLQKALEIYLDAEKSAAQITKNADKQVEVQDFTSKIGTKILGSAGTVGAVVTSVINFFSMLTGAAAVTTETVAKFSQSLIKAADKLYGSVDALQKMTGATLKTGGTVANWFKKLFGLEKFWNTDVFGVISTQPGILARFGENWVSVVKGSLKGFIKADSAVKVVAKWAGVVVTGILNILDNIKEFTGADGKISDWGRFASESFLETLIDVGKGIAITAAVAAVFVTAGVSAPAVLVGAIAVCINAALDVLFKKYLERDFTEFVSDVILDTHDWIEAQRVKAVNAISTFFVRLVKSNNPIGEVKATWAQFDEKIRQAIQHTQQMVSGVISTLSFASSMAELGFSVALTEAIKRNSIFNYRTCPNMGWLMPSLAHAGQVFGNMQNTGTFVDFIADMAPLVNDTFKHSPFIGTAKYVQTLLPVAGDLASLSYQEAKALYLNGINELKLAGNAITANGAWNLPLLSVAFSPFSVIGLASKVNNIFGVTASYSDVWMSVLADDISRSDSVASASYTTTGKLFGIDASASASGDFLGYEAKLSRTAEWDILNGEAGVEVKSSLSGYLAKGEIKSEYGLASTTLSGAVGTVGVYGEAKMTLMSDGEFDPSIGFKVGAEAKGITGGIEGRFGTDDFNVHTSAEGSIGSAKASAGCNLGLDGAELKLEAGAAVFSGEVKTGFTLFGINVDITGEAEAISIGAKFETDVKADSFEIGGKLSFLAGLGLKLKISWCFVLFVAYGMLHFLVNQ